MTRPEPPPPPAPIWPELFEILALGLSGHLAPGRDLTHLLDRVEGAR
jgi:hypothetical protein